MEIKTKLELLIEAMCSDCLKADDGTVCEADAMGAMAAYAEQEASFWEAGELRAKLRKVREALREDNDG